MHTNIEAIQELMEKNGWNKSQLAKELGVSRACISRIMKRQRNPGGDLLSAFKLRFPEYPLEKFFYADFVTDRCHHRENGHSDSQAATTERQAG